MKKNKKSESKNNKYLIIIVLPLFVVVAILFLFFKKNNSEYGTYYINNTQNGVENFTDNYSCRESLNYMIKLNSNGTCEIKNYYTETDKGVIQACTWKYDQPDEPQPTDNSYDEYITYDIALSNYKNNLEKYGERYHLTYSIVFPNPNKFYVSIPTEDGEYYNCHGGENCKIDFQYFYLRNNNEELTMNGSWCNYSKK